MNEQKLKEALTKYKEAFPKNWPDERFKWEAVKCFQDHWDINSENMYQMFTDSTEKASTLQVWIDKIIKEREELKSEN